MRSFETLKRTCGLMAGLLVLGGFVHGPAALADPRILSLKPESGPVGSTVHVIASELFTVGTVELLFSGRSIPFSAFGSPNELRFTVPAWAECGPHPVQVKITEFAGVRLTNAVTFTVLCPGPSPEPGLAQFDTNGNGVIDDAEFFAVIDLWVRGGIPDATFFAVIDAWVTQSRVRSGGLSARLRVRAESLGVVFAAEGATGLRVWVFDAAGRLLAAPSSSGSASAVRLSPPTGRPWANGVYLYTAVVWTPDGQAKLLRGRFAWLR